MKVDLSDVTLCAADSANLQLTARAMHASMERCKFAEAVLFSHDTFHRVGWLRARAARMAREFSRVRLYRRTMARPCVGAAGQDCRQPRFLSAIKKLHKALADPRFVPTVEDNVDMLVCGKYRPILEQEFDVRFAEQLYAQMRKHVSFDDAAAAFRVALKQPHADAVFGLCEQLASPNYGGQF